MMAENAFEILQRMVSQIDVIIAFIF